MGKPDARQHDAHQLHPRREIFRARINSSYNYEGEKNERNPFVLGFIIYLSGGHYGSKCEGTESSNCVRNEELTGCCNLQGKPSLKWSSRIYLCANHGKWAKKIDKLAKGMNWKRKKKLLRRVNNFHGLEDYSCKKEREKKQNKTKTKGTYSGKQHNVKETVIVAINKIDC